MHSPVHARHLTSECTLGMSSCSCDASAFGGSLDCPCVDGECIRSGGGSDGSAAAEVSSGGALLAVFALVFIILWFKYRKRQQNEPLLPATRPAGSMPAVPAMQRSDTVGTAVELRGSCPTSPSPCRMQNADAPTAVLDASRPTLSESDSYLGLTNEEDFRQVRTATKVNIISTPYVTNKPAAEKASATKKFHDNPAAGIYTFNPNTGLTAAAAHHGMNAEQQGSKWLELWTNVLKKVKKTGGKCIVMARGTCESDYKLEGNTQQGEVNVAEGFGVPIEYVYY
jgi:hypothetical protein